MSDGRRPLEGIRVLELASIVAGPFCGALMAEFGVPVPLEDHALRACRAALGMAKELSRLREEWARQGRPQLHARIGINTGRMLVGNLGSRRIMDYTVMGDQVNLASRLEGANKLYRTRIMVSEFTWEQVKSQMVGRELDWIRVKGKEEPVRIYEIVGARSDGLPPETLELVEAYDAALALYRSRRFAEALEAFQRVAQRHPTDGPTRLYVQRCQEHIAEPPPDDWDGVYTMKEKL